MTRSSRLRPASTKSKPGAKPSSGIPGSATDLKQEASSVAVERFGATFHEMRLLRHKDEVDARGLTAAARMASLPDLKQYGSQAEWNDQAAFQATGSIDPSYRLG